MRISMSSSMRIALVVEYDGTDFAGWQWQLAQRTVQGELEGALSRVADRPVRVVCSGRTDAGVHALGQVVHFDTEASRKTHAFMMGTNAWLPADVRVTKALEVGTDFHARTSAIARHYRYEILNRSMASALGPRQQTLCPKPLDAEAMQAAANCLIGEHDFSSFRAQGCQSKSHVGCRRAYKPLPQEPSSAAGGQPAWQAAAAERPPNKPT